MQTLYSPRKVNKCNLRQIKARFHVCIPVTMIKGGPKWAFDNACQDCFMCKKFRLSGIPTMAKFHSHLGCDSVVVCL